MGMQGKCLGRKKYLIDGYYDDKQIIFFLVFKASFTHKRNIFSRQCSVINQVA